MANILQEPSGQRNLIAKKLSSSEDYSQIVLISQIQGIPEDISRKLLAVKGKFKTNKEGNFEERVSH